MSEHVEDFRSGCVLATQLLTDQGKVFPASHNTESLADKRKRIIAKRDELQSRRDKISLELRGMKETRNEIEADIRLLESRLAEKNIELVNHDGNIIDLESEDSKLEEQQSQIDDELDLMKEAGN